MSRFSVSRPDTRRGLVLALLCTVAVAVAFVPVMRLAAGQAWQSLLLAFVVCGTYAAGVALVVEEARLGHPLWRVWSLVAVAGVGMGAGLLASLAGAPAPARWATAALVPSVPAVALARSVRRVRHRPATRLSFRPRPRAPPGTLTERRAGGMRDD